MSGSFSFEEAAKPPAPVSFSFEEAAKAPVAPQISSPLPSFLGGDLPPQKAFGLADIHSGEPAFTPDATPPPTDTAAKPSILSVAGMREAMKPEPGWVPSGILPMATKEVSPGQGDPSAGIKWDIGPVRSVVNPVLDLLEGTGQATSMGGPNAPLAGKVSPEATALMLGMAAGNPNPFASAESIMRPPFTGPSITVRPSAQDAVAAIGAAPDVDSAIAAAGRAVSAPMAAADADLLTPRAAPGEAGAGLEAGPARVAAAELERPPAGGPITTSQVQRRDGVGYNEAVRRAAAENAASAVAAPESIGAAASREGTPAAQIDLSTADMKANRRRAEMDDLMRPPQANDAKIYVEGSFPTLAERSADPLLSQYENLLRQRNPGEFVGEGKRLTENNKARVNEYDKNTIPDPTLNTMRADRTARWNANADNILPTAQPADLTPALDWVQEQLDNPRIYENDEVRGVLENFQERLLDQDGNLKTDPAAVWGIHDNLQTQLAKAKDPLKATSAEKFAEGQLLTAKRLVDEAMNAATDGRFQKALNDYAEDSKAINAGVLFNDFRPKLTNMSGEIQPANFHRFVVNLAKERGDPGIDPSMDISDQGMQSLINIDADLKRAGLIRLGGPAGSPTNLLGALAESAGLDAAHKLLGSVPVVGKALSVGQQYFAQRKMIADTAKHLAPPEGGYIPPDAPEPPPAPIVRAAPAAAAAVPPAAAPASMATAPELPPEAAPAPAPVTRDRAAVAAMKWLVTSPPEGTTLDLQAARRILTAAYGEPFVANLSRVKLSGLLANFAAQLRASESGEIGTDLPAAAGRKQ
jgi:hypothetical protein